MTFIFHSSSSDANLVTVSNDCMVDRQSERRISPSFDPVFCTTYEFPRARRAHSPLILRFYDSVHRRATRRSSSRIRTPVAKLATGWPTVHGLEVQRLGHQSQHSLKMDSKRKPEHIMFAEFARKIGALFVTTEEYERDTYLAPSVDFADLEHRLHIVETVAYPVCCYSSAVSRNVRSF
jgi:hypothetical protein